MKSSRSVRISRREFIKLALIAGGGLLAACKRISGSSLTPTPDMPTFSPTNTSTLATTATKTLPATKTPTITPTITPSSSTTLTPSLTPTPPKPEIDTVIILIEENHSFDSLFAEYPGANGQFAKENCPINETAYMANMMAPDSPYQCSYHENQVPNYWKMARNFSLCDNYFSELKAPSTPNFLMLGTAQSPILQNPRGAWSCPNYCIELDSMPLHLDKAGKTWRDYGGGMGVVKSLQGRKEMVKNDISGFFTDAQAGTLQNVIWIYTFLLGKNKLSGHPPSNICYAENYAVDLVNAVMHGPQWGSTLLFVVWDEWGAFFDHVPVPSVEVTMSGKEYRYGPRVPCIVMSPYAKKGYVSHTLASHVSLLRTIETIYGVKPINERDGKANDLMDCLDFTQKPRGPIDLHKYACPS